MANGKCNVHSGAEICPIGEDESEKFSAVSEVFGALETQISSESCRHCSEGMLERFCLFVMCHKVVLNIK